MTMLMFKDMQIRYAGKAKNMPKLRKKYGDDQDIIEWLKLFQIQVGELNKEEQGKMNKKSCSSSTTILQRKDFR